MTTSNTAARSATLATNPLSAHSVASWSALVFPGTPGTHTHTSPIDHSEIASLPTCSQADVAKAFAAARSVQEAWAKTPYAFKRRIMMRFHDLVLAKQASLLDAVQWETGKSRSSSFVVVADIALTAR